MLVDTEHDLLTQDVSQHLDQNEPFALEQLLFNLFIYELCPLTFSFI